MGACFEALFMGVLMAALDFSCNFFRILTSGFEQCEQETDETNQKARQIQTFPTVRLESTGAEFSCAGRSVGHYADVLSNCNAFYVCDDHGLCRIFLIIDPY